MLTKQPETENFNLSSENVSENFNIWIFDFESSALKWIFSHSNWNGYYKPQVLLFHAVLNNLPSF